MNDYGQRQDGTIYKRGVTQQKFDMAKDMFVQKMQTKKVARILNLSVGTVGAIKASENLEDYRRRKNPSHYDAAGKYIGNQGRDSGVRPGNRGGHKKITPDVYDAIKNSLKIGFSKSAIAKQFSVCGKTVHDIAKSGSLDEYANYVSKKISSTFRKKEDNDAIISMLATIESRVARIESKLFEPEKTDQSK
jgi:DNA invertase Pin-like site-specific DNA recombinase